MFSSLRQGAPFYILTKEDGSSLRIGTVEDFTTPVPKYPTAYSYSPQVESVMDVVVKVDAEKLRFEKLPASASICNYNGNTVVVSDSREAMTAEVESMRRSSSGVISSVPMHEKIIERCDEHIKVLNPEYAERKNQEEQIGDLKEKIAGIEEALQNIQRLLSPANGH